MPHSSQKATPNVVELYKESEAHLAMLAGNVRAALLYEQEGKNTAIANKRYCDLFKIGIPAGIQSGIKLNGASHQNMHLMEQPQVYVERILQLIAQKKVASGDRLQLKDGRIVERDYAPVIIDGVCKGHLWIYNDLSDLSRIEQSVNTRIDKYRHVIANMNLGLMEVDINDIIISVNETFCYMSGYDREYLIGKSILQVLGNKYNEKEIIDRINLRKHGFIDMYQLPVYNKEGQQKWWLMSDAPVFNVEGKLIGSIGIHMDISDQKKMEHELEEAKQRAEDSSKAKETFLANMSHEIRTPMTGILGIANILSKTKLDEEQTKFVQMISDSANSLLTIINDVLDIEKITAGKLDLEHIPFNLEDKVFNALQTFQYKAEDKNINLVLNSSLPEDLVVIGDPYRLGQILNNLLGNALKFTTEGEIAVHINIVKNQKETIGVEFKVQDSGIGIKAEKLNEIFQPFVQASTDTSRKYGGTGLGLTICKNLVEMQGGNIRVESTLNVGTTFIFFIPYKKGEDKLLQPEVKETVNYRDLAGMHVLVAEDVALNQFLIRHILESWGCSLDIVNNGVEALDMVKVKTFDIILMDIHMPEMDGKMATANIREMNICDRYSVTAKLKNPRPVPIIALTAHALKGDGQRYINMGMNGYIAKPYTEEKLYQALKQVLKSTQQGAPASITAPSPAPPSPVAAKPEVSKNKAPMPSAAPSPPKAPPPPPETKPTEELAYDLTFINSVAKDDPGFIEKITTIFLETMPVNLNQLIDAYNKRNAPDVSDLAHKMKSMIDCLGVTDIKETIRDLEGIKVIDNTTPAKISKVKDTLNIVFKQLKATL